MEIGDSTSIETQGKEKKGKKRRKKRRQKIPVMIRRNEWIVGRTAYRKVLPKNRILRVINYRGGESYSMYLHMSGPEGVLISRVVTRHRINNPNIYVPAWLPTILTSLTPYRARMKYFN